MTKTYVWSEKGMRPTMEDTHIVEPKFLQFADDGVNASLYAIFDGHAGKIVADYLKKNFATILKKTLLPFSMFDIPKAIEEAFYQCNENLHEFMSKIGIKEGGSTAVVALIIEKSYMFIANCGDAEAIVYSENFDEKDRAVRANSTYWIKKNQDIKNCMITDNKLLCATKQHKPYFDSEYARIVNAGGFVYRRRVEGLLALSRSFGDFNFKKESQLIIADPHIGGVLLEKNDIVILACDGLWDVYSYRTAMQDAVDCLQKQQQNVAQFLVYNAIARGSTDNVSVIVIQNGASIEPTAIFDQTSGHYLQCHSCHKMSTNYSNNQRRKHSQRRCKDCVQNQ